MCELISLLFYQQTDLRLCLDSSDIWVALASFYLTEMQKYYLLNPRLGEESNLSKPIKYICAGARQGAEPHSLWCETFVVLNSVARWRGI